jgi:hypothetical protein
LDLAALLQTGHANISPGNRVEAARLWGTSLNTPSGVVSLNSVPINSLIPSLLPKISILSQPLSHFETFETPVRRESVS